MRRDPSCGGLGVHNEYRCVADSRWTAWNMFLGERLMNMADDGRPGLHRGPETFAATETTSAADDRALRSSDLGDE
ncbi:hypothetical protein HRS9122_10013 [Pyrenophora teres f. teres]|nr:hypothetical protein HRS9122_10013 [Pyrenophora teres f. teres]